MTSLEIILEDEADTAKLGRGLAWVVRPGDVLALRGGLGAGKTRLVKAIAAGLGCDSESISSPTFTVVQEYDTGRIPVVHVDAYRLRDSDEFLGLGGDELLSGPAVCLIEWSERIVDLLPTDALTISLLVTGPTVRAAELSGWPQARLEQLVSELEADQ